MRLNRLKLHVIQTLVSLIVIALVGLGGYGAFRILSPERAHAAVVLEGTTDSLELVTSVAGTVYYNVSYVQYTTSAATPGETSGLISTATTTTVLPAPGAATTQNQLKQVTVSNNGTAANTITLQKDVSATNYTLISVTLQPGENLVLGSDGHYQVMGANGEEKFSVPVYTGLDGTNLQYLKVGAASEAAGLLYGHAKDTGFPGAWVPGTPGLNGDALDCSLAADATIAGAPKLTNPTSGNYYLTTYNVSSTVAHQHQLIDLIWYNTGLVVTTTTAQSITLPALASRDRNGTTNGEDWQAAIYVTTATTNAGAVTNTTLSYTNESGTAGRTATIASFPATAVAGAFIPFLLQAGDRGIRNIASITLGTSYVTGAISLVLYRPVAAASAPVANVGGNLMPLNAQPTGAKLFNGTCIWPLYLASATTATTSMGSYTLVVR